MEISTRRGGLTWLQHSTVCSLGRRILFLFSSRSLSLFHFEPCFIVCSSYSSFLLCFACVQVQIHLYLSIRETSKVHILQHILSEIPRHTFPISSEPSGLMRAVSCLHRNPGQLNSLFVNPVVSWWRHYQLVCVWPFKKFKYWCLSHIRDKLLSKISWGMRTRTWNMHVYLGLLLVILKYSKWYFWSAVVLAHCANGLTFGGWIF